jgi:peptidyl-prolyl cis-trans isomerase SurA
MRRVLLSFAVALALFATTTARARTLDRVVAIVGDRIILLSEVQTRAAPYVTMAARQEKDPLALARLTRTALHETCERLIDEALIEDEAARRHVAVTDDEVDKAIARVATDNNLTLVALFDEAKNQGYTPATYRNEIKHTILEWKLVQLRMAAAGDAAKHDGKTDEQALQTAHKQMVVELRAQVYIEDRLAP